MEASLNWIKLDLMKWFASAFFDYVSVASMIRMRIRFTPMYANAIGDGTNKYTPASVPGFSTYVGRREKLR